MSEVDVSVGVPGAKGFTSAVKAVEQMGPDVEQALDILEMAVGSIEETLLGRLHVLPGVGSVGREWDYGVRTSVRGPVLGPRRPVGPDRRPSLAPDRDAGTMHVPGRGTERPPISRGLSSVNPLWNQDGGGVGRDG